MAHILSQNDLVPHKGIPDLLDPTPTSSLISPLSTHPIEFQNYYLESNESPNSIPPLSAFVLFY